MTNNITLQYSTFTCNRTLLNIFSITVLSSLQGIHSNAGLEPGGTSICNVAPNISQYV